MKHPLNWWYAISLPQRPPATSPAERERDRYARLTAGLLFIISCTFVPLSPIMIFFSPESPSSPPLGIVLACLLATSWVCGRAGKQILSASCIVAYTFVGVTGPLLTNPLDASLAPLFGIFTISVIFAGALMPPYAALITGFLSCLNIGLISFLSFDLARYNQGGQLALQPVNSLSVVVIVPLMIQIVVSIVVFIIMRNLLEAIRRADKAEQIVALQEAIAQHERSHMQEQRQLEDGLERIAEAHARIANGDYHARVSLSEGHVLWSIAVPLNNLLNRLQTWKNDSDVLTTTNQAAAYVADQLRRSFQTGQMRPLSLTGTPLDSVIVEFNKMFSTQPSRPSRPL